MSNFLGSDSEERDPGAYVPPPPNEVTIRTLDSDVKSMALSGGNFAQSERVVFQPNRASAFPVVRPASSGILKTFLWIIISLIIFGALTYFIYPIVFPPDDELSNGGGVVPTSTPGPGLPTVPPSITVPKFDHKSFFRKPTEVAEIKFNYPVTSVSDLETYHQKITNVIEDTSLASALLELEVRGGDDRHLALSQFWNASGIKLLEEDFWAQEFNPDFTFFVFRNKDGTWPGLLAKLATGRSWLVLKSKVAAMETSEDLQELFVVSPGDRSLEFTDTLVSGQPARELKFSKPSASFIYGYFHNYLVISTSLEGLKEAISRL